jgi:serine/threonine protein kinase/Flp pilus assembly protein TadD
MSTSGPISPPSMTGGKMNGADLAFDKLVDDLLTRLQAGESVDWSAVERDHSAHADRLRSLAPALTALGDLSRASDAAISGVAATEDELTAGVLGDFRIIREVGRGGMGIVYEATQISLIRPVALKVLPFAATMDPRQLQRFRHEAQAAALLHHPNIVPVHGVGCERGVHYYAMQLIEGRSLAAVIEEWRPRAMGFPSPPGPLSHTGRGGEISNGAGGQTGAYSPSPPSPFMEEGGRGGEGKPTAPTAPIAALSTQKTRRDKAHYRRLAELAAQAADALEYAHSMGVVHRDIKPGNLMLDEGGNLWVTDFGLAKLSTAVELTMSGDLLGTLRYMSPEQALARHGLVDHRTDVYSLGATLYELLTLRPAVDGKDKAEILKHLAFEEPVALRKLDKAIPAELETIALKCLAKEPGQRYATAGELAADLRRFAEDKAIIARRPTVRQRFGRRMRKHPVVMAVLGLVAGMLIAGTWAWGREKNHAEAAVRAIAAESDGFRDADRLPEALLAAQRAADLLPRFGGDAALRRQTEERVADLQLLNRLEEARVEMAAVHADRSSFDYGHAIPQFFRAFQEFGTDIIAADEPVVIESLRRRAVADQIVVVLFDWVAATPDPSEKERLCRIIEALDSDPRRIAARAIRADQARDTKALRELFAEATADLPPPAVLRFLASAMAPNVGERLLRAGQRRYPADFWMNHQLALALLQMGRAAEAVQFFRAAVALRPRSAGVQLNLGSALLSQAQHTEAEAAYRRAIELSPDYAEAYRCLGQALRNQSRYAEAETAARRSLELRPDYAPAHRDLGVLLAATGRPREAVSELRQARQLKPDYQEALELLGAILVDHGWPEEALDPIQRALELKPGSRGSLNALGTALIALGRATDAEPPLRLAIKAYPRIGIHHKNLGVVLMVTGRSEEGRAELRRAIELTPGGDGLADLWLRDGERMAAAYAKLPLILTGTAQPADQAERLALAVYCLQSKRFYPGAQLFAAAFAAAPEAAQEMELMYRYGAAACAAGAGCGQGEDAAKLDDAERTRLRKQALDWLTAELASWTKRIPAVGPAGVRQYMLTLRQGNGFNCIRETGALARLPKGERVAWQMFWGDVDALTKRCDELSVTAKPPSTK